MLIFSNTRKTTNHNAYFLRFARLNRRKQFLFLIFFLTFFSSVFQKQLHAQAAWEDSCSGIKIVRQVTPALNQDSNILLCINDTFSITDLSTDELHSETLYVRYRIDGGNYNSGSVVENAFSSVGNREIEFEISNDSGCILTSRYFVKVLAIESQIDVNMLAQCLSGNEFEFQALHTQLGSENLQINHLSWKLLGLLDTQANSLTYSFDDAGTYEIQLEVGTTIGCSNFDTISNLQVLPSLRSTISSFNDTLFCYQKGLNDTLIFTGIIDTLGSVGVDIQSFYWQYGSDTFHIDTLRVVFDPMLRVYGKQEILFNVESADACLYTDTLRIYIAEPPQLQFTFVDSIVCKGSALTISNTSTFDVADEVKSVTYIWNGLDTAFSTSSTIDYFPSDTGLYLVDVFVRSQLGCADSIKSILSKSAYSPLAQISYSRSQICDGDTSSLYFDAVGQIPENAMTTWIFDGSIVSNDSFLVLQPTSSGLKSLVFQLETLEGCKDTVVVTAGIVPQPDIDIIRTNNDSCLRNVQRFVARNKVTAAILTSVIWTFEDSTQVYDSIVAKAFTKVGDNKIKVSATDRFGCSDSAELTIVVSTPPNARFVASSLTACEDKQKFNFYDSSTTTVGTIVNTRWIFSDGTTFSNPNNGTVAHTFQSAGSFLLSLAVTNSLGCVDTFRETVTVSAKPTADFTINNTVQCLNINEFRFTNLSTSNSAQSQLQYFWDFGDSSTSTQTNTQKKFSKSGTYRVSLVASSPRGCTDSISSNISVLGLPTSKYGLNSANQCLGDQSFVFTDSSVNNSGSGSIISREWFFGDNTSQTGASVTKVYANAGSYQFQLRTTLSNGCYDSILGTAVVNPKPRASFSVNKDTQCVNGNNFVFDNKSSIVPGGGSVAYEWTFADTIKTTTTHPSISFASFGNFKAKLLATSQFGCKDLMELPVQVTASPKVDFTSDRSLAQCNKNDTFVFNNATDSLNGNRLSYIWNIADGSNYNSKNIRHSFQNPGVYDVVLIVSNSLGCTDSIKKVATVYPDPELDFIDNGLQQCFAFQDFQFTNSSKVGFNGGTMSYVWLIGADSMSNTQNFSVKNLNIGDYGVKLKVVTSRGCSDSLLKTITVLSSPEAQFLINDTAQCLTGNSFVLDNTSTSVGNNPTYQWIFGDGSGSRNRNFTKTYTDDGLYKIALIATTDRGCSDTTEKEITIYSTPKVAFNISDTALCLNGNAFKFTAASTNKDGSSLIHSWYFEQGKSVSADTASYSFTKSGKYLVKLTAESTNTCIDSALKFIEVYPQPQALFSVSKPQQCLNGNVFAFNNLSNISDNSSLNSFWDLGNGVKLNRKDTQISYLQADTFKVELVASSNRSCTDTFRSNVYVNPQPVAGFTTVDTGFCLRGNEVKFTNISQITSGTVRSQWEFGDGRSSSGTDPVNKYSAAGVYKVKLVVISNLGCNDSIQKNLTLYPNPEAGFRLNSVKQCLNQNKVDVIDTTKVKGGAYNFVWNMGDGKIGSGTSYSHKYDTTGEYRIYLAAISDKGCTDTAFATVSVLPNPKAKFDVNDSIQCLGTNDFVFDNRTTLSFGKFITRWNYGDGTVKESLNGRFTYVNPGLYKVSQIVISSESCADTARRDIFVTEQPKVSFMLNKAEQCQKYNLFEADNTSVYNGTESVQYLWEMGNGDTSSSKKLSYSYPLYGTYALKLTALTSEGCRDSFVRLVRVNAQGAASFNLSQDSFCFYNNLIRFNNSSRVDGDRFAGFQWNFGDGIIQNVAENYPVDYSYNKTGTFDVKLITTTLGLCKDTSEGIVTILEMPIANAEVNNAIYCLKQQNFEFKDISNNSGKITNRQWLINRNIEGTAITQLYKFPRSGKNFVDLIVNDDFGCSDTARVEVDVLPSPTAEFSVNRSFQCLENNEYIFLNNSIGTDGKEGFWQPEPLAGGFQVDLTYNYMSAGTFGVKLTVYNDEGCEDTIVKPITVHPTPEGMLMLTGACVNSTVNFDASASIVSGSIQSYEWVLGDGTFSRAMNPQHEYTILGKMPVSVLLKSDKGCVLKMVDTIEIYPLPDPKIGTFTEVLNINQPILSVYDSSETGPYFSYVWDMGDGSDLEYDFEVSHKYADTGIYTVTLTAESFVGCIQSTQREFYVAPDFNLLFPTAFSPNGDGINEGYQILGKFQSIKFIDILIKDELGNTVFRSNDVNMVWNGKYFNSDKDAPSGTYIIQVLLTDIYRKQFETSQRINLIR